MPKSGPSDRATTPASPAARRTRRLLRSRLSRMATVAFAGALALGTVSAIGARAGTEPPTARLVSSTGALGGAALPAPLYSQTVTIDNPDSSPLTDYQVEITLDASNFDFAAAAPGGADLRFYSSGGTTALPYWIQSYDATAQKATIWVKVPELPADATTTIVMRYGNEPDATSASDGNATFPFFDDFAPSSAPTTSLGYFALSTEQTVMVPTQSFETSSPHSFSVVELDQESTPGGYKYYAYYGPQNSGYVGLAGSNDMTSWTKLGQVSGVQQDATAITVSSLQVRWPSVVRDGTTLWVALTEDYTTTSHIALYETTVHDLTQLTRVGSLVTPQGGGRDQNPNLWYDAENGQYYLYWYSNAGGGWSIMARQAATPTGLEAATNVEVLHSGSTLAAPNMLYYDGTYFLATEINGSPWQVEVFASTTSPTSGFTALPGSPQLPDNSACPSQNVVGTTLYLFTCKLTGSWTLDLATADLSQGRTEVTSPGPLDPSKWTTLGGTWGIVPATLPDGSSGYAVQGDTTTGSNGHEQLEASYAGSRYVLEADGRQVSGRVWGLGVGEASATQLDSVNLYDDLGTTTNLYLYKWGGPGSAQTLQKVAVGTIDPGTWYHFTVSVNGSSIGVLLDGKSVMGATDPGLAATGHVALYGENGTEQFAQVFVRAYATVDPSETVGPRIESQAITFPPIATHTYGDADFSPEATATSALAVTYAAAPSDVCSVTSSDLLHILAAGTCTVTASQAGDDQWAPAEPVVQTFAISKVTPTLVWATPAPVVYGTPLGDAQLDASASVPGSFAYTPPSGTVLPAGTHVVTATFTPQTTTNYTTATKSVTVHVAASAPEITSPATAYFAVGRAGAFTITTTGSPTPALTESGELPWGLSFTTTGGGTASISGTPSLFAIGTHFVTLRATNGVTPPATQKLAIVVGIAPVIVTRGRATFTEGDRGVFVIFALGYPAASLSTSATLPEGLSFKTTGFGTATISGTPAPGTAGTYHLTVTAANGVGATTRAVTVTVDPGRTRRIRWWR